MKGLTWHLFFFSNAGIVCCKIFPRSEAQHHGLKLRYPKEAPKEVFFARGGGLASDILVPF